MGEVGGPIFIIKAGNVSEETTQILTENLEEVGVDVVLVTEEAISEPEYEMQTGYYCIEPFSGDLFQMLIQKNQRIIGTQIANAMPMVLPTYQVQHDLNMKDVVLCLNGIDHEIEEKLSKLVQWMGGQVESYMTKEVSVVVSCKVDTSVKAARSQGKAIVTPSWIEECWAASQTGFVDVHLLMKKHQLGVLAGCMMCIGEVGLRAKLHARLVKVAESLGATCLDAIDDTCTHYILNLNENIDQDPNYEIALRLNLIIIKPKWLFACQSQRLWCDEARYMVETPIFEEASIAVPKLNTNGTNPQKKLRLSTEPDDCEMDFSILPGSLAQGGTNRSITSPQLLVDTPFEEHEEGNLSVSSNLDMSSHRHASTNDSLLATEEDLSLNASRRTNASHGGSPRNTPTLRRSPRLADKENVGHGAEDLLSTSRGSPSTVLTPDAVAGKRKRDLAASSSSTSSPKSRLAKIKSSFKQFSVKRKSPQISNVQISKLGDMNAQNSVAMKRRHHAEELYEKEATYFKNLTTIIEVFKTPLETEGTLMSQAQIDAVFINVEKLAALSEHIVNELKMRIDSWNDDVTCISDVFEGKMDEFLTLYRKYITGHENAKSIIDKLMSKSKPFHKFISACESNPRCKRLSLSSLLMHPVQHIARYSLFFKDLQKTTPNTHPEGGRIPKLLDAFSGIMSTVNEAKMKYDRHEKLFEILSDIDEYPPLVCKSERWFIKRFDVKIVEASGSRKYALFLFNDSILIAIKQAHMKSKLRGTLHGKPIRTYRHVQFASLSHVEACDAFSHAGEEQCVFNVRLNECPERPEPILYTFETHSEMAKHQILKELRDAILAECGSLTTDMEDDAQAYEHGLFCGNQTIMNDTTMMGKGRRFSMSSERSVDVSSISFANTSTLSSMPTHSQSFLGVPSLHHGSALNTSLLPQKSASSPFFSTIPQTTPSKPSSKSLNLDENILPGAFPSTPVHQMIPSIPELCESKSEKCDKPRSRLFSASFNRAVKNVKTLMAKTPVHPRSVLAPHDDNEKTHALTPQDASILSRSYSLRGRASSILMRQSNKA